MSQKPLTPTRVLAARVRELRRQRGWTAAQLGVRMAEQGIKWDRSIVANLENGRRATVSVDEWFALAYVLEVPPVSLIVPTDLVAEYMVTPAVATGAGRVEPWLVGSLPLPEIDGRSYGLDRGRQRWTPTRAERRAFLSAVYPELPEPLIAYLADYDNLASELTRAREAIAGGAPFLESVLNELGIRHTDGPAGDQS
jgi:transcriptional regulator with XRE-family HTH domain